MRLPELPRITFIHHAQSDETQAHSILISLLRGLAAVVVATAHLRAAMYPAMRDVADPPLWFQGLAFVSGFAHQAVLVFFVISGWLVGGSLLNRLGQPQAIASYAIDRVTRLWTVLIPTFGITLLIALGTGSVEGMNVGLAPDDAYSAATMAGNLIGLQGMLVPDYGDNFPLWSLANETWYYVMFPLLALAWVSTDRMARSVCAVALVGLGLMLPSAVVAYFSVWLLGVAFSRIRIACSNAMRWALLVVVLAVAAYCRLTGELDTFALTTLGPDLICSILYLTLLSSMQFRMRPESRLVAPLTTGGRLFAEFSFSLYVLHVPVIGLLQYWSETYLGLRTLSPAEPMHAALYFAMLAFLLLSAYLSYLLFESRTHRIRRAVKRWLFHDPRPGPERSTRPARR